jgi:hypothetical protein
VSSQVELSQQQGFPLLGYASRLLSRTEVAQDTVAFRFERPRNFLFRAGQSIDLTLLGARPDGSDCLTHTFSIASSLFVEEILVATRIRDSAFKGALSVLPLGTHVNLSGPMGLYVASQCFQASRFSGGRNRGRPISQHALLGSRRQSRAQYLSLLCEPVPGRCSFYGCSLGLGELKYTLSFRPNIHAHRRHFTGMAG